MSPENATNERTELKGQVRFLRAQLVTLAIVLAGSLTLLGYVVVRDRIRIVPPEVRQPYEIGANYASKEYLLDNADYVLSTIFTVTPETVEHNNATILKMAHPDGYGPLKASLDAAARRMRKERVTTIWVPRSEDVEVDAKRVTVHGTLKTYIADRMTSERKKDYVVQFTVTTSGRLYVSTIQEVVDRSAADDLARR